MNIRQLTYFIAVYENGSFNKASQALFLSQQALSRSLAALEEELTSPLFYRDPRGVRPTALGDELYAACQPVLREMEALNRHMSHFVRHNYGQLRIGVAAGARYLNTKTVWNSFLESHPHLSITVHEYTYKHGLELLDDSQLDALILSDHTGRKDYVDFKLKSWRRMLLVPKDHPLSALNHATFDDFRGQFFVLSVNDLFYDQFTSYCRIHNCMPREISRVSDILYMHDACSQDRCLGITIDRYFTEPYMDRFPELITIPFRKNLFPYTISMIVRNNHAQLPILTELARYLKSYLHDK